MAQQLSKRNNSVYFYTLRVLKEVCPRTKSKDCRIGIPKLKLVVKGLGTRLMAR